MYQKEKDMVKVADTFDLSLRQTSRIIHRYRINGLLGRKIGSGRPTKLTRSLKLQILKMSLAHPEYSAKVIANNLNNQVSHDTVNRYLKATGFSYRKASKVPLLSAKDIKKRLDFAEDYLDYDFSHTVLTDESTFVLDQSYNIWGPRGQRVQYPARSHPPKVQMWAAISASGKVAYEIFTGNMKVQVSRNSQGFSFARGRQSYGGRVGDGA